MEVKKKGVATSKCTMIIRGVCEVYTAIYNAFRECERKRNQHRVYTLLPSAKGCKKRPSVNTEV